MSGADTLQPLLEVRGVRYAALLGESGAVQAQVGTGADQAPALAGAGAAIVQTLQQTLGTSEWDDLVLEVEGGPVLLLPAPHGARLAVGFHELSSLGRVRLSVKKVLTALK